MFRSSHRHGQCRAAQAACTTGQAGGECCRAGAGRAALAALTSAVLPASPRAPKAEGQAGGKKPNILVIFGDDIGQTNISAYSMGLVGYHTPNIDRIAKEGMIFTDYYAEQSCTAGRSSFITGQCVFRTGLSKVGVPARRSGFRRKTRPSPSCSSRWATRRASSARTISATGTSICRRPTALTSSSATCIT